MNSKKGLLLVGLFVTIGLGLIFIQKLTNEQKKNNQINEIKEAQVKITAGCDMTTFDGRIECFKDRIKENRSKNKTIKIDYQLIGQKDKKPYSIKLRGMDLGNVVQIERPKDLTITSCAANTLLFDWNVAFFYFSPDSYNSGAICETPKDGRIAIVPSDLTQAQITEFYKRLSKPLN